MKNKFLAWFLLFCALGLSGTAAYYSVLGLSKVFVGVALPVIVMGSFLEISKIAIATYLHDMWKKTYWILKIYMTIALITLSVITSLGIYGLLSEGFQGNISQMEVNEKKIKNVETKKERFIQIKDETTQEKQIIDSDIAQLREGLSKNITTSYVDRQTGQLVTYSNKTNRKVFEDQLNIAQERRDTLDRKISALNDSITNIEIQVLNMESEEISGSELGVIKYLSEVLGWSIKKTANLFVLVLIFVFDPLAITLVIATNQAFKSNRLRKKENKIESRENIVEVEVEEREESKAKRVKAPTPTPTLDVEDYFDEQPDNTNLKKHSYLQGLRVMTPEEVKNEIKNKDNEPKVVEKIVEVIKEVPVEVIKEIEVPVYIKEEKDNKNVTENEIKEENIESEKINPKRLSYSNRNGGSFKINRL